jgi:hypothetical protein
VKKSIALYLAAGVALICAMPCVAQQKSRPETAVLPASEYRTPLDEIIVEGKKPYWQGEATPRFDRPKVEAPKVDEVNKSRLQWAPGYKHDERDDYAEPRDPLEQKPRAKIFELKF